MYFLRAVAMVVGLLLAGGLNLASAQAPGVPKGPPGGQRILANKGKLGKQNKQAKQARQAAILERFLQMSPQERRQALRQLPPAQRQLILRRLNAVEMLSAQERRTLRGRLDTLLDLPADRQQAVRRELQQLRQLTPEQRRERLASPELRESFSPDEVQLMDEVAGQE